MFVTPRVVIGFVSGIYAAISGKLNLTTLPPDNDDVYMYM